MQPKKVLIVDAQSLCYAAHYGVGGLGIAEGPTGVIYGFFNQIQKVCREQLVAHIIFCWDSRQSHRRRIFPGYKSNRKHKEDPDLQRNYPQFDQIRKEIIPRLGFVNNFMATGFEADDLIASICRFPGPDTEQQYIIFSSDHDLYQLLNTRVSMYKARDREIYTHYDFTKEYGISPNLWASVKAMAGCTSDTVPGIRSVGEKTACKYIINGIPHKVIDTAESRKIIERNKPLVTLPYKGTPKYVLDWDTVPSFSEWISVCEEFEFNSFLRDMRTWENIFSGVAPADASAMIEIGSRKKKK